MTQTRAEVVSSIVQGRADFDRAFARLNVLAADDRKRVGYSAHALNNYLAVVSITLELLRKKLYPQVDQRIKRLLDSLSQATALMTKTAQGMLTATPEALPHLLAEPTSLAEIAEGVCRTYRAPARNKRVRIICRSPVKRDRVLTDSIAVGAVLDNLISNAVKYSSAGTAISVSTVIRDKEVVCSVHDHGPGLSEADQAKLFQRGVRLSAQPTAGESSDGYGLAIANDLTKALGGRLRCASILGRGSCFAFSLPFAQVDAQPLEGVFGEARVASSVSG